MRVDIWSDIACPWCYVGKRRLERALERFEHREQVEIVWHSFLLDPGAPPTYGYGVNELLVRKYGVSAERAAAMNDHLAGIAAGEGLAYRLDIARPGNTFDAHRLTHLAAEHGLRGGMTERFMRAFLCEGESLGDQATLQRLAIEAGLPADEVRAALASDAYAGAVRADIDAARKLGIQGVPFFLFAGRYAISGAEPVDSVLGALMTTWDEIAHPAR